MSAGPALSTLLLDLQNWDLTVDGNGNIAVAAPTYSLAQDVASACLTFLGEVFFDVTLGVPYTQEILGHAPTLQLLQSSLVDAALTVPGVVSAQVVIQEFDEATRTASGQVQFVDSSGNTGTVAL